MQPLQSLRSEESLQEQLRTEDRAAALDSLSQAQLEHMAAAGEEVLDCLRVLKKGGLNLVGEVLKAQGTFYELEHYPKGDVYDPDTHSQYYYHAHRGLDGEHGHFHTFMRARGMPPGAEPVPYEGEEEWPRGDDALSHIVCISMDRSGLPIGMFTTNRWVTAEAWYPAEQVVAMAERFCIDHAYPSWPTNRWLTAMFWLFMPEIRSLLHERDRVVREWARAHPNADVFEDRELEIPSAVALSIEARMAELHQRLD